MNWTETRNRLIEINEALSSLPEEWEWRLDISGANLSGTDLREANLRGADLSGADLRGADLSGADLRGADLSGADLRGADLRGADLRGADLAQADLYGAYLYGAKNIIHIEFEGFSMWIQSNGMARIGCQYRKISEWLEMSDDTAIRLGAKSEHLAFYRAQLRVAVEFFGIEN